MLSVAKERMMDGEKIRGSELVSKQREKKVYIEKERTSRGGRNFQRILPWMLKSGPAGENTRDEQLHASIVRKRLGQNDYGR